jgi:Gas vesicle synthesis protein GvpL/GvpF
MAKTRAKATKGTAARRTQTQRATLPKLKAAKSKAKSAKSRKATKLRAVTAARPPAAGAKASQTRPPDAGAGRTSSVVKESRIAAASRANRPAAASRPSRTAAIAEGARPAAAAAVGGKGRYVYCIIRSDQPLTFGPIGIGEEPAPIYTVRCDDLSAVVSDAPLGVLDPTRDNVLAHQRVNETVMREHTVLPMSFGTVFKTREDVTTFLKSAYRAFSDVLDKMEAKLEFGLKVLWDRDAVIREIEHEDEDIHRLKNEIAAQKGSTYFARMQYGRLIDVALQTKSEHYVAEIFERLRDVSVAARANKPIGDRMILNAAFLVSRDSENAFDGRVKQLGATHDKLTFKYTGPWPPYNFVNIRLKLERA